MMPKKSKMHKQKVRSRYERLRVKAYLILKHKHEREYKKIIHRLLKGGTTR